MLLIQILENYVFKLLCSIGPCYIILLFEYFVEYIPGFKVSFF
jgi:hypothetical protein